MSTSVAYYNYARWVAECPNCDDARLVYAVNPRTGVPTGERLTADVCANGHAFDIEMPDETLEAQIVAVLSTRPNEADRGWYPAGHPAGIRAGQPTGQTVAELEAENADVARYHLARRNVERDMLRQMLAQHGITVRPDGTFEGAI